MYELSGQSVDTAGHSSSRKQSARLSRAADAAECGVRAGTEHVRALPEAKLRELERCHRLMEMIPVSIVTCTGETIDYANAAARNLFGVESVQQLLQTPLCSYIHPDDAHLLAECLANPFETAPVPRAEVRIVGQDGQQRIAEVTGLAADGSDVPVVHFFMRDVTEQKHTEELLRKSDKLSVVGQLAAGVAHEIRNPLTSIRGFIQLMREEKAEKGLYYDIILAEIDRIELIINQFLVLAKPQADKFQPKLLSVLLEETLALIQSQAAVRNVEIFCSRADPLPPVVCEENQIKQLFLNILKNAIEATSEGGRIFIEIEAAAEEENLAVVRIRDEGVGIPPERLSYLGEPFYSTKEHGTGLGLFISYKIAEHHNGKIRIQSEDRKGTTVEVYLPVGK